MFRNKRNFVGVKCATSVVLIGVVHIRLDAMYKYTLEE